MCLTRVRERKTVPLFSVGCRHLLKFQHFCGLVGKPYGVNLPCPSVVGETDVARLSFVKKFCGGFLEEPVTHPWHEPTVKLARNSRWSIRMSLFLFRKALPSLVPDVVPYLEKMSTPGPLPDQGFLRYVETAVPRMFPSGWDSNLYPSACLSSTVPVKSCYQRSLKDGGSRLEVIERGGGSTAHHRYVMDLLTRETPITLGPSRVSPVETGGKQRIISTSDVQMNLFRPLHTAIYNRLSSFKWLLRGEATASRFNSEFRLRDGEVFVSGDYESATDNLSSEVQMTILRLILDNTSAVPSGIRDSALSTLRVRMHAPHNLRIYEQKRGQLMGNLISFPLLCIVNYLAFRYFSGTTMSKDQVPVRVNGDDIVFRSTPEVADRWKKGVVGSGLTLSPGKTMVDRLYFSLNSSLFVSGKKRVRLVPVIRSTAYGLADRQGGVETLRGRWRSSFPGFSGVRKSLLRVEWLKWNRKWIVACRRSLTRGLGLNVSESEIRSASLWERECFYLSMARETALPVKRATLDQVLRVPHDWQLRRVDRITKDMRLRMRGLAGAFVECAWSEVRGIFDDSDYRDRVDDAPSWTGALRDLRRCSKLLGLSPRNARRYLKCTLPFILRDGVRETPELSSYWRQVRVQVWLPAEARVRLAELPGEICDGNNSLVCEELVPCFSGLARGVAVPPPLSY